MWYLFFLDKRPQALIFQLFHARPEVRNFLGANVEIDNASFIKQIKFNWKNKDTGSKHRFVVVVVFVV